MQFDSAVLRRLYLDQKKTLHETARELGISSTTVWKALLAAGIPRRPKGRYLDVAEVKRLYVEEEWSQQQIADKFGITRQAVQLRLAKVGVPGRTRSTKGKQVSKPQ